MVAVTAPTISERIENAFSTASRSTGTSFDYLLRTASRESSFDAQARASKSSASGLFQFIESTWLELMKEAGPHLGLERYAQHIERTGNGSYKVEDAEKRAEILELRNDPETSSLIAGAYTRRNAGELSSRLGRAPTPGELYMAHFLGARGAERLINASKQAPNQNASDLFPSQARANKPIFYDSAGRSRSASEVYKLLARQHDGAATTVASRAAPAAQTARAGNTNAPRVLMTPQSEPPVNNRVAQGWQAASSQAPFDVLFRTDPSLPRDPVGPTFWSAYTAQPDMLAIPRGDASAPAVQRAPAPEPVARDANLQTRVVSHPPGATAKNAATAGRQPLNLTDFLNYSQARSPRNLLPPT